MDNANDKYKAIEGKECGEFWCNYPDNDGIPLDIRKACNMIIHATDIVMKTGEYYYREEGDESGPAQQDKGYFQGKIMITGQNKRRGRGKSSERAELDLTEFTQHCVELSGRIEEGG